MADDESLQALEALHRDLVALVDNRLTALDRLRQNLEDHLEQLKALVTKRGKNDQSRKALSSGTYGYSCAKQGAMLMFWSRQDYH